MHCKYNNRGRGIFLCGSHKMFSLIPPRDYISDTEQNQISRRTRMRMERVLGGQGRMVWLKINGD
jgi:hypothetical protein